MRLKTVLLAVSLFGATQGLADHGQCPEFASYEEIEAVRTIHEDDILAIEGVNGIGQGYCDDAFAVAYCMKIYTEIEEAKELVLEAYPNNCVDHVPYIIEHVGTISPL